MNIDTIAKKKNNFGLLIISVAPELEFCAELHPQAECRNTRSPKTARKPELPRRSVSPPRGGAWFFWLTLRKNAHIGRRQNHAAPCDFGFSFHRVVEL